jgi:hypothetical protein
MVARRSFVTSTHCRNSSYQKRSRGDSSTSNAKDRDERI